MNTILGLIRNHYKKTRKRKFTEREKILLRPIAETIAILDGNAFWGLTIDDNGDDTWYEQYLQEAWMIYRSNPGLLEGTSWYKDHTPENTTVKDAYDNWRLLKMLSKKP
jgi:hypothetical protein